MRKLILLLLLLGATKANADQVAIGLVTIHHTNPNQIDRKFSGCLHASCEAIYNPVLAYRMIEKTKRTYDAYTLLAGVNSIHEPIVGAYYAGGIRRSGYNLGVAMGVYMQNNEKFLQRGIIPFSAGKTGPLGIVPIIGVEHQYRLTKKLFINTLITPVITNVGLGLQF
jgi:hypothetical protein